MLYLHVVERVNAPDVDWTNRVQNWIRSLDSEWVPAGVYMKTATKHSAAEYQGSSKIRSYEAGLRALQAWRAEPLLRGIFLKLARFPF